MAPDWVSPTEGNGAGLPRADLHVALVVPTEAAYKYLKDHVRIIQPPLWPGKVHLHVITTDMGTDNVLIRQTMADLGMADSRDIQIGPPESLSLGYPSGTEE